MTADNNEPKRIAQPPKEWKEGYEASGRRRSSPRRNPYPRGSDEALTWISGYIEGKTKPPQKA
jgi:hypothetical protein